MNEQISQGDALTRDDAVAALTAAEEAERLAREKETEARPTAEDALEPEAAIEGEEEDADGEIAAPHSWDAEAKARFAELPRDVQELIAAREKARDRAVARAHEDAARARKQAQAEGQAWAQRTEVLDQLLPQARQTFASRWGATDWDATLEAYGPEQTLRLRQEEAAEAEELQRLEAAQQESSTAEDRRYLAHQEEALQALAPDLADPREGAARRQALGVFLLQAGADPNELRTISALETSLAYDAMRWRQAQKTLAAKPRPSAQPAKAPVKPAAAAPVRTSDQRRVQQLEHRFAQTRSREDAAALLIAKGL
jgi:hypothetical protein